MSYERTTYESANARYADMTAHIPVEWCRNIADSQNGHSHINTVHWKPDCERKRDLRPSPNDSNRASIIHTQDQEITPSAHSILF